MLRRLLEKIFKRNMDGLLFIIPFLNLMMCYLIFSEDYIGDSSINTISFFITISLTLIAIAINLRRFVITLDKPYQKSNLHIVISSIFSTITFFSVIYSLMSVYIPGSFSGLTGPTQIDSCVNALYFSVVTFTTVGYGDIHPLASVAKIFVSIETMSFFIFFVILTSNHSVFFKPKES